MLARLNASDLLDEVEAARHRYRALVDGAHQAALGQYFTPPATALRMADMFRLPGSVVRVLDPGAGVGALTAALVTTLAARDMPPRRIEITAVETDRALIPELERTLRACARVCAERGVACVWRVAHEDFVETSVASLDDSLFSGAAAAQYDAVITNPPYRKIGTTSPERRALDRLGVPISNLYAAFVALAVWHLAPGGEVVAITPRSWCNGTYFQPFRRLLLGRLSFERFHVYGSRTAAFEDDAVLTENVIYHAVRQAQSPTVRVTESEGPNAPTSRAHVVPFDRLVRPGDPHAYIHLTPDASECAVADRIPRLPATLATFGLQVSTGRVVDFRAREWLRKDPGPGTSPLVYPTHFGPWHVEWPKRGSKKCNALAGDAPPDLLVPAGHYVLVKRFSSKEERRRVVATVFDPAHVPGDRVGFENHLNYFHAGGRPMEPAVAYGLAAYLNSEPVDQYFRQFSGHTQVNATDLRTLRYPDVATLRAVGAAVVGGNAATAARLLASALSAVDAAA